MFFLFFCCCFYLFVFFGFLDFLVFALRYIGGGRSSRQQQPLFLATAPSIFGHFRKRSEAIGNFENFRKQNLSESSEGPHSEPICKQFLLWTTHEHF